MQYNRYDGDPLAPMWTGVSAEPPKVAAAAEILDDLVVKLLRRAGLRDLKRQGALGAIAGRSGQAMPLHYTAFDFQELAPAGARICAALYLHQCGYAVLVHEEMVDRPPVPAATSVRNPCLRSREQKPPCVAVRRELIPSEDYLVLLQQALKEVL